MKKYIFIINKLYSAFKIIRKKINVKNFYRLNNIKNTLYMISTWNKHTLDEDAILRLYSLLGIHARNPF